MKRSLFACWLAAALMLSGCAPYLKDRIQPIDPGFGTRPPAPEAAPAETPDEDPPRVRIIKGTTVENLADARRRLAEQAAAAARPRGLETRLRSLVLRDVPVRRIAELLTEAGGINVLATDAVATRSIDILLRDMPLQDALDAICRLNGLWYRQGEGIVTLMSREEYLHDLTVRRSEQTRAFYVRYTNAADMAKVIQAAMGDQVRLAVIENEKIYGHIDPEEEADVGGGAAGTGQELAVAAAEAAVPAALPRSVAGKEGEALRQTPHGEKPTLAILTVFKRNNCIVARSLDGALLNEMAGIVSALDTPTSQVLLEVRILQLTLDDDFQSFFDFDYTDSGSSGVTGAYDVSAGLLSAGAITSTSLDFVLDGAKLDARISLFKKLGRAEIISTPFLMAANNSKVEFFVGQETPLRDDVTTQTVPIGDTGATITTFEVDIRREELGTDVEMTTFINEDGTVTLEIEAEISTPNLNFSSVQVVNEKTGKVLDFPIDGVDKSEIKSILSARSGQSIAIGGIIRETVDVGETKVPVLGDIPLLGAVFRKTGDTKQKTETVIILTPHVIVHPALAGEASDRFLGRKSSHGQIVEGKENLIDH
jgi:type II secretory pathway component GspD/PulD (secretin)